MKKRRICEKMNLKFSHFKKSGFFYLFVFDSYLYNTKHAWRRLHWATLFIAEDLQTIYTNVLYDSALLFRECVSCAATYIKKLLVSHILGWGKHFVKIYLKNFKCVTLWKGTVLCLHGKRIFHEVA